MSTFVRDSFRRNETKLSFTNKEAFVGKSNVYHFSLVAFARRKIDKAAFRKPADIDFLYDISLYWPETLVHYIIFNVLLIEHRFFFFTVRSRFKIMMDYTSALQKITYVTSGVLSDVLHLSSADIMLWSDIVYSFIVYDDVRDELWRHEELEFIILTAPHL